MGIGAIITLPGTCVRSSDGEGELLGGMDAENICGDALAGFLHWLGKACGGSRSFSDCNEEHRYTFRHTDGSADTNAIKPVEMSHAENLFEGHIPSEKNCGYTKERPVHVPENRTVSTLQPASLPMISLGLVSYPLEAEYEYR
jgi:hypothetical protein